MEKGVLLITQGNFEKAFLDRIAFEIKKELHMQVLFQEGFFEIADFYDPVRRQYDANRILQFIDNNSTVGSDIKKMGLFRIDLFIPVLTYIFGQAVLNGQSGIASLYRLRNEQYGMKKDDEILINRFVKVIIHELGHMHGLVHCHNAACVMRSSTYVEDLDQKKSMFCASCKDMLKH